MTVNITKPVVGASVGSWGTQINAALDAIVTEVNAQTGTFATLTQRRRDQVRLAPRPRSLNPTSVTVTTETGGTPSITSPQYSAGNASFLRFTSCVGVNLFNSKYSGTTINGLDNTGYYVETDVDTAAFAIGLFNTSGTQTLQFRVFVDDVPVTDFPQDGPTAGASIWVKIAFGTRGLHNVKLLVGGGLYISGVALSPTDIAAAPSYLLGPKTVFLGDSWTAGANATGAGSLAFVAARALGWDPLIDAEPGTGWVNPGTGGRSTYGGRVPGIIAQAPENIVIVGSRNDTATGLQAAATAALTALQAGLPNANVYMFGYQWPSTAANSGADAVDAALQAAATAAGSYVKGFFSMKSWITGTGNAGATTGSGAADVYISSDGVHPTQAGQFYYGKRIANAIASLL